MLTAHSEYDVCEEAHEKPVVIDFCNSQRYGVDIVNQMIRYYSCQSTCDSWLLIVFTFILSISTIF